MTNHGCAYVTPDSPNAKHRIQADLLRPASRRTTLYSTQIARKLRSECHDFRQLSRNNQSISLMLSTGKRHNRLRRDTLALYNAWRSEITICRQVSTEHVGGGHVGVNSTRLRVSGHQHGSGRTQRCFRWFHPPEFVEVENDSRCNAVRFEQRGGLWVESHNFV